MGACKKVRITKRRFCVGDLRERITIQNRSIATPDNLDFDETFDSDLPLWAGVKTMVGVDVFDDSNTAVSATHDFIIRFRSDITAENWILWNNERYDILLTEDYDGQRLWLRLRCNLRGSSAKEVNKA